MMLDILFYCVLPFLMSAGLLYQFLLVQSLRKKLTQPPSPILGQLEGLKECVRLKRLIDPNFHGLVLDIKENSIEAIWHQGPSDWAPVITRLIETIGLNKEWKTSLSRLINDRESHIQTAKKALEARQKVLELEATKLEEIEIRGELE